MLRQYIFYITTIKNRSSKTAYAYAVDLENFFKFCKLRKQNKNVDLLNLDVDIKDLDINLIKTINLLDVYEYLNYVMVNKKNAARARARKASAIRGFFKYLTINLKVFKKNPVEELEIPTWKQTLPKYLSLEESVKLLNAQLNSNSKTRFRDYCILTLFLNCGMRLSELEGINLKNLKLSDSSLKIIGKGNKERIVFLNEACKFAISNYCKLERCKLKKIQNKEALFLASRTGVRLCARQIQKIVAKALNLAGLSNKGYSVHKLRHTAATLLYQYKNVDILILKDMLGHSNVGTTEIYTHVSNNILKKAMLDNPLNDDFKKKIKISD